MSKDRIVRKVYLRIAPAALAFALPVAGGCLRIEHKVDPVKIEPIYATIDINLKIDRQLDDFFAFENGPGHNPAVAGPATRPTGGS